MAAYAALAGLAGSPSARAHGGLSMEQDLCKLTVGRYFMHFAGYQEDAQRSEFCEDIPMSGRTFIVLDFIDDPLRETPVEVRIARRDASGTPTTDLIHLPPRLYPGGTITLDLDIPQNGDYVGIVTAGKRGEERAVFPFAVGRQTWLPWLLGGLALLPVLGFAAWRLARSRYQQALIASNPSGQAL